MTLEETGKILATIICVYPNFHPEDIKKTAAIWQLLLADYDYKIMGGVLKSYMVTNKSGFAPSPSNLIQLYDELVKDDVKNELEAWALVSKAVRKSGWHAEEAFNELPPLVQKAVGSAENLRNWSQTKVESFESVIGSNFIKAYREVIEREKKAEAIPMDIRPLIEAKRAEMVQEKAFYLEEMKRGLNEADMEVKE